MMREDIQRLSQQVTEAWMTCCQKNVPRKGAKYTCATCGKMIQGLDRKTKVYGVLADLRVIERQVDAKNDDDQLFADREGLRE